MGGSRTLASSSLAITITFLLASGCSAPDDLGPAVLETHRIVVTPSGLRYIDLIVGTGVLPQSGQMAVVDYTIWLEDGTKVDSSFDRGSPFRYIVGMGRVIAGFEEGVASMRVGGRRWLIIPPDLAYGDRGAGGVIPPGALLKCEVDLLAVE